LRSNDRAAALDLPDLVDWMLATGCRIGEALAVRHGMNVDGKPLLDLQANTWEVNATVVRIPKHGLVVQPRPKTAAGWRVVALPTFAVDMVRARPAHARGIVFAAPAAHTLRDPSNCSG
jgi:integrase